MKPKSIILILFLIVIIAYIAWKIVAVSSPPDYIVLSGFIEGTEVTVRSEIASQVTDILVQEGQKVNPDDVIAKVDPEKINLQLESAKSEYDALLKEISKAKDVLILFENSAHRNISKAKAGLEIAEQSLDDLLDGYPAEDVETARLAMELANENLNYAEDDFNRMEKLFEQGVISRNDFEKFEQTLNAAKREVEIRKEAYRKLERGFDLQKVEQARKNHDIAELTYQDTLAAIDEIKVRKKEIEALESKSDSLKSKINLIESQVGDYTIRSPIKGVITEKLIEEGELVSTGTPVVSIVKPNEKWIRIYVPATYLGHINLGDELPVILDAYDNREFKGRVSFIAEETQFTPKNVQIKEERIKQVYEVKLDIVEDAEDVKAGMEGDVHLSINR